MRILVTNDDGVDAPGLAALAAAVGDLGDGSVIAPTAVQSAAGHRITLKTPMTVRNVRIDSLEALSVDGSPADCVRLAVRNLLDERPDLVLSGINAGVNVGFNVFYSGTVAAAGEATMFHIPAVAFSAWADQPVDWDRAARLCRWVLDGLLAADALQPHPTAGRGLINVNIPPLGDDTPKGVRICRQSRAVIDDVYQDHGDGTWGLGDDYRFSKPSADTDVALLQAGFITVTPLLMDMTDRDAMGRMRDFSPGDPPA